MARYRNGYGDFRGTQVLGSRRLPLDAWALTVHEALAAARDARRIPAGLV